jgi:nitrate/TMAO reductase-like tetraheme cytochrome c subunit
MDEQPAKRASLASNLISEVGAAVAAIALINLIFLVIADVTGAHPSPYLGILAYMVVPAFLTVGLVLFVLGVLLERQRRRKVMPDRIATYPRIDLNETRVRRLFVLTAGGLLVFVFLSIMGTYRAYEFTDSDEFCGTLCHTVMHPEYTAYKASPHARVGCVGCHVGTGATWYVRSKMSGSYQVYAALFRKYPRPIPSPVANLRPAQQTCEQCHWPEKFFGAQLKVFSHFGYDEKNTPREIRMLIKTGGGSPVTGVTAGIHWHMNIANKITYVSTDAHHQKIPWVRVEDRSGRVTEYNAQDAPLTPQQIASRPARRMDCVDCHNRPTHIYLSPDRAVDRAMLSNAIDRNLPFIKQESVNALVKDYTSTPQALQAIAREIPAFYAAKYPDLAKSQKTSIDRAVSQLLNIFQTTRFPEMRVDWRTHPDNIGHFYFSGCFRCHDNQHVSKDGKVISKDCDICHSLLGQAQQGTPMIQMARNEFQHPVELGDLTNFSCSDCHTGATMQQ